jgi:hypothetical chaperone protein
MTRTLGIDFGTSNSAAGVNVNGAPFLIEIEPGEKTVPTSVFFDPDTKSTRFGGAANRALIRGDEGRFMRALKSVLGTSLMGEKRRIMGQEVTLYDVVGQFLAEVKCKAEEACYCEFEPALSGRPVHFHSSDAERDRRAEEDLRLCYARAGFKDVRFLFEPEAAAISAGAAQDVGALGLIVDIGGGTSDFSVFRSDAAGKIEVLASNGVRLGGTNFDRAMSFDHVMPLFGKGAEIKNELGPGRTIAPNALFNDLATWQKIPFLYTGETRRTVAYLERMAVEPKLFSRFSTLLEHELGHEMAFAIEAGKIRLNAQDGPVEIDLSAIEKALTAAVEQEDLRGSLEAMITQIGACADETLLRAGLSAERIDRVVFVGGSSLMKGVVEEMRGRFSGAEMVHSNPFTAVVDGLAIASAG